MSKRIKNILPKKLPFSSNLFLSPAPSSSPDFVIEHIPNNRLSAAHLHMAPQFRRSASTGHPLSNSTNKLSANDSALMSQSALVNIPSPQVVATVNKGYIQPHNWDLFLFSHTRNTEPFYNSVSHLWESLQVCS